MSTAKPKNLENKAYNIAIHEEMHLVINRLTALCAEVNSCKGYIETFYSHNYNLDVIPMLKGRALGILAVADEYVDFMTVILKASGERQPKLTKLRNKGGKIFDKILSITAKIEEKLKEEENKNAQ